MWRRLKKRQMGQKKKRFYRTIFTRRIHIIILKRAVSAKVKLSDEDKIKYGRPRACGTPVR